MYYWIGGGRCCVPVFSVMIDTHPRADQIQSASLSPKRLIIKIIMVEDDNANKNKDKNVINYNNNK